MIHDRYRQRMFAYTRQMLAGSSADAEDAVQEIFVRAYVGLRASDRRLALRAWLYRIAHNRCIDELRRPQAVPSEEIPEVAATAGNDPVARLEQRDALRRLIADVQRLPEQQRSALLMRELAGMTYADVSGALGVSVPAVKSLLVRARVGLAQANEARDTACARIREDMIVAHDRGVRASGLTRRHLRDCPSCREFRSDVRGVSRQLAAFVPVLGPLGLIAKLLGIGGGGGAAASSTVAGGGAATSAGAGATAATGLAGSGAAASAGAIAGAGHVVTILAAAVVTAGGAIELQHISPPVLAPPHHHRVIAHTTPRASSGSHRFQRCFGHEPGPGAGHLDDVRARHLSGLERHHRRFAEHRPAGDVEHPRHRQDGDDAHHRPGALRARRSGSHDVRRDAGDGFDPEHRAGRIRRDDHSRLGAGHRPGDLNDGEPRRDRYLRADHAGFDGDRRTARHLDHDDVHRHRHARGRDGRRRDELQRRHRYRRDDGSGHRRGVDNHRRARHLQRLARCSGTHQVR